MDEGEKAGEGPRGVTGEGVGGGAIRVSFLVGQAKYVSAASMASSESAPKYIRSFTRTAT